MAQAMEDAGIRVAEYSNGFHIHYDGNTVHIPLPDHVDLKGYDYDYTYAVITAYCGWVMDWLEARGWEFDSVNEISTNAYYKGEFWGSGAVPVILKQALQADAELGVMNSDLMELVTAFAKIDLRNNYRELYELQTRAKRLVIRYK
jgi:hypothetical protein